MKNELEPPDLAPDLLEERLREVEAVAATTEFDRAAWIWMILLGVVFPVGLIVYGWASMASGR